MTNKDQLLLEEAYQAVHNNQQKDPINNLIVRITHARKTKNNAEEALAIDELESMVLRYPNLKKDPRVVEFLPEFNINPSNVTSDMTYAKKRGYVESFVHGIQPISEAKKKINPWAVEKSIKNKMEAKGKKVSPKKEEEIVKGIKKTAKKYGKKITSDKVKNK